MLDRFFRACEVGAYDSGHMCIPLLDFLLKVKASVQKWKSFCNTGHMCIPLSDFDIKHGHHQGMQRGFMILAM